MNVEFDFEQFDVSRDEFGAERAVVGACLASPDTIGEMSAKLTPEDFTSPALAAIFSTLVALHGEGRKPSVESVIAALGNGEVEPGLFLRPYLEHLRRSSFMLRLFPLGDAVGVIREAAQRRLLAGVGSTLLGAQGLPRTVSAIVADALERLDDIAAQSRQSARLSYDAMSAATAALDFADNSAKAITTGLTDLDRMLGGWPRGELSVLAGRPGMGKSAVATSCLIQAAKRKNGAMFFSLEMTKKQLGSRIIADAAWSWDDPIYYQDIARRELNDRQFRRAKDALGFLKDLPIVIEEERGLTISDVTARARKQAAKWDHEGGSLDVVFVDHMLLVRPSSRYAGNRVREVAEISDGLAALAKELNCAVVALCQLNRGVEGREVKRPTLSDLRDSGAIEEDASTVTFIYRPAYYLEQQRSENPDQEAKRLASLYQSKNDLELIVAKNRNGACGLVDVFVEIGANAVRDKARGQ